MPPELLMPLAALVASLLTFLSGFGLGTLLMPVFAVFFPVEQAIAMTGVVHLLNNVFKFALLWKQASKRVVFNFGIAGMIGAWFGAQQLMQWMELPPLYTGVRHPVTPLELVIGCLMVLFALLELMPATSKWSVPRRFMFAGGTLSGFFGGLSGYQGALRSIFLLRAGLEKEAFIASGVGIALMVDVVRLPVYLRENSNMFQGTGWLIPACIACAFIGALLGKRLLPKITVNGVRYAVAGLLFTIAMAILVGVI